MATAIFLMYSTPFSPRYASISPTDFGFAISNTATGLCNFAYGETSMAKRAAPVFVAPQCGIYSIGLGIFMGVVSASGFVGGCLGKCYADGVSGH